LKKLWEGLLKNSWWVVAVFVVVTAFMVVGVKRIVQESSAEAMNPERNAIVDLNKKINKDFDAGRTEVFVLYADNVFTAKHLNELRAITEKLKAVDGVKKVTSLTNTTKMLEVDGVLQTGDMVSADNPTDADIAGIKHYLETNYILKSGLLAAKDGKSTNILVEFLDSVDLPTVAAAMEQPVKETWTGGKYDLTGIPSMEQYMLSSIHRDIPLLLGIGLLFILVMFVLNFRSPLGSWLPLLQVILGLIWGAGMFGWMGLKFQQLTIIAPIGILAVGSSFTLHLLGRYFLELSRGTQKREAIIRVLLHTGLGVFVSGLAIAASMLTFLLSDLAMVRGLGIFCALGVLSAMVSSLTLVPAILNLLPAPKVRVKMENAGLLAVGLRHLGGWTGRHAKGILAVGAVMLAVAAFGIFQIVPNTSLVAFFRPETPVMKGMDAVNKVFGGSTTVKVVVDGDLQDPKVLRSILAFQENLKTSLPQLGACTSIASLIRSIHETLTGEPGLPATHDLIAQELLVYQASGTVDDITSLANLNYTQGVITIIAPRMATHDTKVLFTKLEALGAQFVGANAKLEFAGDILSEVALENTLIHDFILSLTLALILVIFIDSLIRSVRAALVTIIVLVSTIILQYGLLGLTGVPFNLATALAGALAIGVGDYAVHLTVRYMEDRKAGLSPEDAITMALTTSGRSIFFTALTIGGGFLALMFGEMLPVSTLGGVMVMTVVIVGVATLTLLPAACVVFLRNPVSHVSQSEVQ